MTDREKALEAALRHAKQNTPHPDQMIDDALAMPATVDRASWEAGRDVAEKAVTGLIESNAHDSYTGRLYALNKAREAIRNLTPPEDAP